MLDSSSNNWIPFTNESYFYTSIESDMNLIVLKDIFKLHPHQLIWKVEYRTTVLSYAQKNLTGESSILFYVNRPPLNGTCDIKPKNGSTNDLFYITCEKWSDDEGSVSSYSFFGNGIGFLFFNKIDRLFSYRACRKHPIHLSKSFTLFTIFLIFKGEHPSRRIY
jgi:hypothetical protein